MAEKSCLYLLPIPLAENSLHTIPEDVKHISTSIKHFFVENIRTARRYLKSIDKNIDIDTIEFSEINQHNEPDLALLKSWIKSDHSIGVMSEAGCPGIADPGSALVTKAHEVGFLVRPLVGPSSILLSLMGSGFNGQGFRFVGYLPVKDPQRSKSIKEMEDVALIENETQIFIETPYRNNQLLQELIKYCQPQTRLCIAANLTAQNELIKTNTIRDWLKNMPNLHKQPTIFLIGK